MKVFNNLYGRIVSWENLALAWDEFKVGKIKKTDVMEFEFKLEQNLFALHEELVAKTYCHGPYASFYIRDPKVRHIHKATVRDRVLHHAVFRVLSPIFESTFIPNSFSCRVGKGTHKGVMVAEQLIRQVSRNFTQPCYVLKCDVRKFFDSIEHGILLGILKKKITDPDVHWLLERIIGSFTISYDNLFDRRGVPIGNLTSQLFANVYLNEFDQYVKQELKVKYYARYTDDFMIVGSDRQYLANLLAPISEFLRCRLKLVLHPKKISLRKYRQGVDFLGLVILPHHRVLRNKTKHRMFRKLRYRVNEFKAGLIDETRLEQSLRSYQGVLSHADAYRLGEEMLNRFWWWTKE
jgi:retron-type reverse transcriptase